MTAPEPHSPPQSRREARLQRERDAERAREHATRFETEMTGESGSPVDTRPLPVVGPTAVIPATAVTPTATITPTVPLTPTRVGARRAAHATSRRAAKTAQMMDLSAPPPRHARNPRPLRVGVVAGLAVVASLVLGSAATVTAAVTGVPLPPVVAERASDIVATVVPEPSASPVVPLPAPAASIPAPTIEAVPAALELCAMPEFTGALAAGDDSAAIAAAGGPVAFRSAVAAALAPCVALDDPARVWVVINKTRPAAPIDYRPAALATPDGVRSVDDGTLRSDAAAALTAMAAAAASAGVGEIGLESGFRSHTTQQTSYTNQVSAQGVVAADLSSARPGFSEHQSGLAADLTPCAGGCGTLDDFAASTQGQWIAQHAWEFGWVVRYEDGHTPVTGYSAEPWHLRYIGPELAQAYHDGGWHTLEEFFGLPAAPTYLQ